MRPLLSGKSMVRISQWSISHKRYVFFLPLFVHFVIFVG